MRLHDIWALRAIDGNMIDVGNFQKHPVLEIHLNDMKIFGNDGCNTMFGSIETLDEKTIVFGAIGGTKMACSNMELSSKYTSGLEKTKTYKLDGLQLYLYDADGNELLRFENGGLK